MKQYVSIILCCFFFVLCSREDIDEIKGKKQDKYDPVTNYFGCVAQAQSCIEAEGEDCFIVKDNSRYFIDGGGGVEAFCFDEIANTYFVISTGSM